LLPVTRYAKSGDVHVAYQLFGEGPLNLVFAPLFVSNIELYWEQPDWARWLLRLGNYASVAMFDKRGTGGSIALVSFPVSTSEWTIFGRSWMPRKCRRRLSWAYPKAVR